MKRLLALLSLLFMVFAPAISMRQVAAQTAVLPDSTWNLFRVTRGSYLFAYADTIYGDGNKWETLYSTNVRAKTIPASSLHFKNGVPYVDIVDGQQLYLPRTAPNTLKGIELIVPNPQLRVENMVVTQTPAPIADKAPMDLSWLWWLAAVLVVASLVRYVINRKLANPVTSGRPMRDDGISDETAPNHFQTMASNRTGSPGSPSFVAADRIRVINVRRGRGYGLMRVRYRDRTREEVKRLNGEAVYEATVEYPDRRQETLYCLQACANDIVYFGNRYIADRLFRFEADTGAIHTPQPQTTVNANGTNINISTEEITVTHQGHTIVFGADGWKIGAGEDGGLVLSGRDRTDVLFQNGRVYGAKVEKRDRPRKPATPVSVTQPVVVSSASADATTDTDTTAADAQHAVT